MKPPNSFFFLWTLEPQNSWFILQMDWHFRCLIVVCCNLLADAEPKDKVLTYLSVYGLKEVVKTQETIDYWGRYNKKACTRRNFTKNGKLIEDNLITIFSRILILVYFGWYGWMCINQMRASGDPYLIFATGDEFVGIMCWNSLAIIDNKW